jgi:hypothetical protein
MPQRIGFAGASQHTCDGENTHNRVSSGSEPQNDLEHLPDHRRRLSAEDHLHKEATSIANDF